MAAAVALVAHSLVFNFVTDDAFISFVYSRNLAEHGKLVFNLGEHPVEGYTNFLWTVLLAALLEARPRARAHVARARHRLRRGHARHRAPGCRGACARRRGGDVDWSWWDALPALFLAGVPGYACWSSGGLETQMFAFLVTLGAAWHLDELSTIARRACALRSRSGWRR